MEGKMKVRTYKVLFLYNIITRWIFTYLFFFNRAEALIGSGGKKISFISLNSHDRGNYKDSVSINIYDRVEALKR